MSVSFFLGKGHSRLCRYLDYTSYGSKLVTMWTVKPTRTRHDQVLATTTFCRVHSKMIKLCPSGRLPTNTQRKHIAAAR